MEKRKIIIFGATGNVGSYLVDYLDKRLDLETYEIIAVGRRETNFFEQYDSVKYFSIDVSRYEEYSVLPKSGVACIVFLAGILPAYTDGNDPQKYIRVNTLGGANALEYARKCHAEKFIYSQSISDLAGYFNKEVELKPDMPRNLLFNGDHSIYVISKCAVVDMMKFYHNEYGLKTFVLRLPNIYMFTRDDCYNVDGISRKVGYRLIMDKAMNGEQIEIWGDPNRVKDIVYVADLCQMINKIILNDSISEATYNVGTGKGITLEDQIRGIVKVFCPQNNISKIVYCPDKPNAPQYIMNIDNAKKDLGYIPEYDYEKYLNEFKKEMKLDRFKDLRR